MRAARLVIHVAEHISAGLIDPVLRTGVAVTSISTMITSKHAYTCAVITHNSGRN